MNMLYSCALFCVLMGELVSSLPLSRHLRCSAELEKLVHLEGEMIDFCVTLIEEEYEMYDKSDTYNFTNTLRFLEDARRHDAYNMGHEQSIIDNPLAMFKLKRWLAVKWTPILDEMMESRLIDSRPELLRLVAEFQQTLSGLNVSAMVEELVQLMFIYDLPVHAVARGTLGPAQIDPLSAEEIFQLVETLNELEQHQMALQWLRVGLQYCNSSVTDDRNMYFNNLLGATYLKLRQYEEAKSVYTGILQLEADNRGARSNLKLIERKMSQQTNVVKHNDTYSTYIREIKSYCHDQLRMVESRTPLDCRLVPLLGSTDSVRLEELHRDPDVFILYDVFGEHRRRVLVEKAAQKLWTLLTGRFRSHQAANQGSKVYFSKERWWMEPYITRMRNITYRENIPWDQHASLLAWTSVANFGAGIRQSMIRSKKIMPKTPFQKQQIAHYYIFLEVPEYGGEIVFPELDLRISPLKGAAVFWQFRTPHGNVDEKLARTVHCPVLIGTQWNAKFSVEHQGLFERLTL